MSMIVLIPGFLAAYFAFTRSPHWAFINVYIPAFFLFPGYYHWKPKLIPDPNFAQAAIMPIMLVFLLRNLPGWRFSFTDILVIVFALFVSVSEYLNFGYKEAQNLMFNMLVSVLFPYILTKSLVEPAGLREEFAKRIVLMLCIIALLMAYESLFRSGYTIWHKVLGRFFDGQGWHIRTNYRWGLVRANGPFYHPIPAAITIGVGLSLQNWLNWSQAGFSRIRGIAIPKLSYLITLILLTGLIAPLSRAPWIGAILALMAVFFLSTLISLTRQPKTRYLLVVAIVSSIVIGGIISANVFKQFASVSREEATESSQERETIAYRFELYTTYGNIVMEKWVFGWGQLGWPKDAAQKSIDNQFIFLALNHGLIAVFSQLILFFYLMTRLFIHAMNRPAAVPPKSAMDLTLLSILVLIFWCATTVSLIGKVTPLLFIIFGWCDGYLCNRQDNKRVASTTISSDNKLPFHFKRVLT
ncbi:MAG TPA: O-antigen ligase domain-containing protein [Thiotrichaceae bacterium]|nr:O-antigen ligase domain-containing protein [Thiotrichaceae bacterium]